MFTYEISFTAREIDESALRGAIEATAGVRDISIRRKDGPVQLAPAPAPAPSRETLNKSAEAILAVLRQHSWIKSSDLIKSCEPLSASTVRTQIFDLHRAGKIIKVAHGIYTLDPSVTPEQVIEVKQKTTPKTSSIEFYLTALKNSPKTAVELRDLFGVTRQRVEQVLSKLMKSGDVERYQTDNEAGQFVYCLPEDRAIIRSRDIRLRPSKSKLMSLLLPDKIYLTSDVAAMLGNSTTPVRASMDALVRNGLVTTFRINSRHFVYLTAEGTKHPDYDATAPKCLPVNFIDIIGSLRARFVETLDVLGAAKTFDLTCCLEAGALDDKSYASGQIIQRMKNDDIIHIKSQEKGKHAEYELTRMGKYIAAIIARYRKPPERDELLAVIETGRREKMEKIAIANGARRTEDGLVDMLAPTHRGMLAVLLTYGQCSTPDIVSMMEPKFTNPRSVHLAIRTMEQRGLVKRAGREPKSGAAIWEITQHGATRLAEAAVSTDAAETEAQGSASVEEPRESA